MIEKYDAIIYPFDLYVAIDKDLDNVLKEFKDLDGTPSNLSNDASWKTNIAVVWHDIHYKDNNANCYLIVFPEVPTVPVLTHEAFHVIFRFYEYIGEQKYGNEATAYLLEWIVDCIMKTINKYNDTSLENN